MKPNCKFGVFVLLGLALAGVPAGAASLVFSGANGAAWETASNWTPAQVPTSSDDVSIPSGKSATVTSSVTCKSLSVAGTLTVTAQPLADVSCYGLTEGDIQLALYQNATVVQATGTITFESGAKVYPTNDPLTGTPVIFRAADITVESGATVDASGRGWGRFSYTDAPPANTKTNVSNKTYTYARGSIAYIKNNSHLAPGSYGGAGAHAWYAATLCGFDFAPLFPGSPGSAAEGIGGGTICLQATGDLTVLGTLKADGTVNVYSGSASGGGIWLAGATVSDGEAELISASAPDNSVGNGANGGGGRIGVSVGYSAAQLETMAGGTLPVGETVSHVAANIYAKGGVWAGSQNQTGEDGTVVLASNPETVVQISFSSPGLPSLTIEGISTAPYAKPAGSTTFDVPEYAYWSTDPTRVRYSYAGAIVSNTTSQIATFTSSERHLAFTTVAGQGPYTVALKWNNREAKHLMDVPSAFGTFKVNGIASGSSTSLWVRAGVATTIEFVPAAGCTFKCWNGSYPRLHAEGNPMTCTSDYSYRLTALVTGCTATGQAIKWKSNVAGSWDDPTMWDKGVVPTLLDDVTISTGTVSVPECFSAKSLTVSGGSLTVGVKDGTTPVFGTVASNLTVGATMTVYPARAYEYDKTSELTFQNSLYDAAAVMRVGGTMTVNGKLYPKNDPLTGVPTIWRVGSFSVGSSGQVLADCGFAWRTLVEGDALFDGTFQNYAGSALYTHGYGRGYKYGNYENGGSGHGGKGGNSRDGYGQPYGFEYAPLMPGSPSGQETIDTPGLGTVCVFAEGTVTVNGTIRANGTETSYCRSGGAIWLSGSSIGLAETAVVNASGASTGSWQNRTAGGGRVLFTIKLSDTFIDQLIDGLTPADLDLTATEIAQSQVTVAGGRYTGTEGYADGDDGTKWQVLDANTVTSFSVSGEPVNYLADGVDYNTISVDYGTSLSRTAPEWAYNTEAQTDSRYAYAGYLVSNATQVVSTGTASERTATISFVRPKGPYWLVWKWGARQTYHTISVANADWGSVTLNGDAYVPGTPYWSPEEREDEIVATPAEGCEFVCWTGDVPEAQIYSPTIQLSAEKVYHVAAIFRRTTAATTYHWKKNVKGLWSVASNWVEENVPGELDSVEIESGSCIASNRFAVQNLIVTNTASLTICGCRTVSVVTNILVADSASLRIVARETDATHTWTNGSTTVQVGLTICVTNSATLYAESDAYTGGAPVFRCKDFIVGTNATVSAKGLGFGGKIVSCADVTPTWYGQPENLCPYGGNGAGYRHGGAYGGYGGAYGTHVLTGSKETIAYGYPYGLAVSPIHPGAASGGEGSSASTKVYRGGGLIRVHAARIRIEGTVDASADSTSTYGGAGGGIWLTTSLLKRLTVSPSAKLLAVGGSSNYDYSRGGGGRIALGAGLSDKLLSEMIEVGGYPRHPEEHVFEIDTFTNRYPGVTVKLNPGGKETTSTYATDPKYFGSFYYVTGQSMPFAIIVR